MAARIKNKYAPEDEGPLYGTVAEAEAALQDMLKRFKSRGHMVTETEDEDGRLYGVSDEEGRPVGIYYIE